MKMREIITEYFTDARTAHNMHLTWEAAARAAAEALR